MDIGLALVRVVGHGEEVGLRADAEEARFLVGPAQADPLLERGRVHGMGELHRGEDLPDLRVFGVLIELGGRKLCVERRRLERVSIRGELHMVREQGAVHLDRILLAHCPVRLRHEQEMVVPDPLPIALDGRQDGDPFCDDLPDQVKPRGGTVEANMDRVRLQNVLELRKPGLGAGDLDHAGPTHRVEDDEGEGHQNRRHDDGRSFHDFFQIFVDQGTRGMNKARDNVFDMLDIGREVLEESHPRRRRPGHRTEEP